MSVALAATLVAVAAWIVVLRRRLELVVRAEHELRGPAASLELAVEGALRGGVEAEEVRTELDRLRLALDDLHEARSGRRAPAWVEETSLERVVRTAAAVHRPLARRLGGSLRLDWRAGEARVRADRRRLGQALANLIANAIEHGGGHVELRGWVAGGRVRVEVRDAGPGIGSAPGPDRRAGRGRGLSVARRAVEEAGGRLEVAARNRVRRHGHVRILETGTAAVIELPLLETAPEPSARRILREAPSPGDAPSPEFAR